MGCDIDVNSYSFEQKDVALWGSMKKAKNETEENGGVVSNFCDDKDNLLENSCCELDGLKIEMTKEPQKKDKEIVFKKEEEKVVEKSSTSIVSGEYGKNWYIKFLIDWKFLKINPKIIKENWIWFSAELANLEEITIETERWNFVVKDGFVYDWNMSMDGYVNKIKDFMWGLQPHSKYLDILSPSYKSNIRSFTLDNYKKNVFLLNSILFLEEARVSENIDTKQELLVKSAESLNMTYYDKVFVKDLEYGDLMGVVEEKLDWILGRGV